MLETPRLLLRHMTEDDLEDFLEIFTDPLAMKYFGVIFDRKQMETWVHSNLAHQEKHGFSLLTVILKETNEIIGDCGLESDTIDGVFTIGIGCDLKRAYWNQGYATEAGKAVIEYGFTSFDFDRISAWVNPKNLSSVRAAEKIGLRKEKSVIRGKVEQVLLTITKSEWAQLRRDR